MTIGLCCLPLAACGSANTAEQASDGVAASDIKPRLVVQVGHRSPVEGVAWANYGKDLVSLGEDGSIVLWDAATGNIVNRAQLPANGGPAGAGVRFGDWPSFDLLARRARAFDRVGDRGAAHFEG